MRMLQGSRPLKVETYRTRDGREFTIRRRARPGRRSQAPRETGEKLSCPYCGKPHPVLYYMMREGEEGQRKVKSWDCPKTGKMSLNVGRKFQAYIDSITIMQDSSSKHEMEHVYDEETMELFRKLREELDHWDRMDRLREIRESLKE